VSVGSVRDSARGGSRGPCTVLDSSPSANYALGACSSPVAATEVGLSSSRCEFMGRSL
jgi:hypothetical protein